MKTKEVNKKHLPFWILSFLMMILVLLAWKVNDMETPTKVKALQDGNSIVLVNGKTVRLLGIDATKGGENEMLIKEYLKSIMDSRNLWVEIEGEKGEDNTYLAWVWVGCESRPKFLASSLWGKNENPIGCQKGVLVNEQIIRMGWSKVFVTEEMGSIKYEGRLIQADIKE